MHYISMKILSNIEATLTSALNTLTLYNELNQLRPNPSKTQVCAFHLRNKDAKRELNVVCNETRLIDRATPVYLGIHLHKTLSYKVHTEDKYESKCAKQHNLQTFKFKVGVQSINTRNKLSRSLLLGCRIRLSCFGKE